MFTGTLGSSGGLTAAPATGLTAATGNYILGVAKEAAATNDWIYVQEFGEVKGINTSGSTASETWVNGDILYYNPAVTGGLTKNVPTAPNAKVQVAAVVHADASNGILFVRPTFEPRLNDLSNVFAISPTDGDVIVWDNADSRWENRAQSNLTAGRATNLAGGATGSLPYQSAANTTTFLAAGTDGQVLKLASGVPTWSSDTSGVTITDDTTTNATRYITFSNLTTGNETTLDVSSTKLQFNPSTGALSATSFSGSGSSLSGIVTSNVAGTGISVSGATGAVTITNSGVTSAVAGTGVSVSGSTGAVTFSIGQAVGTSSSVQFGSFGVGTAASGTTGEIRATNNVTAFYSDERLKTKTGDIENALDKVCQIETMLYHANEIAVSLGYDASIQEVGLTAQSVQKVQPEVVVPAPVDANYLTVRYEKLVPLLIEAIKELKSEIDDLKGK
jgi:hypothetical protein